GGHSGHDSHEASESKANEVSEPHGVHESPKSMWIPLAILAALSVVGGLIGIPGANLFERFMEPAVAKLPHFHEGINPILGGFIGTLAGLLGILAARSAYEKRKATAELLSPE